MLLSLGYSLTQLLFFFNGEEALRYFSTAGASATGVDRYSPLASARSKFSNSGDTPPNRTALVPQLVLMDIVMPGISGVEVMRALPTDFHSSWLAIAMTGSVDKESVQSYSHAGFVGVLSKPFNSENLEKALRSAVTQWEAKRTAHPGRDSARVHPHHLQS